MSLSESVVSAARPTLTLYSPSGVVMRAPDLRRAASRLERLGFAVTVDTSATAKFQRFAGDDFVFALHQHHAFLEGFQPVGQSFQAKEALVELRFE